MPGSCGSLGASPVFKKASVHPRKQLSLATLEPTQLRCDFNTSGDVNEHDILNLLISADAHRNLGLAGTLDGSIGAEELNSSDPDSDIPDELQVILSNSDQEIDDTLSFDPNVMIAPTPLPSPDLPPEIPLPSPQGLMTMPLVVHTNVDNGDNHADVEDAEMFSEDDTKKSFDFTGKLQKLNESDGSHRVSFVARERNPHTGTRRD